MMQHMCCRTEWCVEAIALAMLIVGMHLNANVMVLVEKHVSAEVRMSNIKHTMDVISQ